MYSQAYWLYDKKYMYVFVLTLAHKIRFLSIFFYKESLKRDKYKFLKYFLSHCMQEIYCSGVIIVCIFLYICKQEMFFSQRIMFRIIEKLSFWKIYKHIFFVGALFSANSKWQREKLHVICSCLIFRNGYECLTHSQNCCAWMLLCLCMCKYVQFISF